LIDPIKQHAGAPNLRQSRRFKDILFDLGHTAIDQPDRAAVALKWVLSKIGGTGNGFDSVAIGVMELGIVQACGGC